ncbi:S8 family peptidase [[Flexibacter] sp. ATCC 35208]|uniref:S8 family peptidase n=1 Tax=[Flexibacter] sp. ATCC 35208 TaxID=1936242 RepID=UPI0009CF5D36|nr:S8 family peptidase [[Flexibacter] sp. ATCC 35208]OMP74971.1 hypothetical protein BW716_32630 [[Flexibacter] sp. ATCC 35208]
MPIFHANHLIIDGNTTPYPYTTKIRGASIDIRSGLNKISHGRLIKQQLRRAVADFEQSPDDRLVYVVLKSPHDFLIDISKLDEKKGIYQVRNTREIEIEDQNGNKHIVIEATVYLNREGGSKFLKKADDYINKTTRTGQPRNQSLIANIDEIRAATLQSFWQEPELPFPALDELQWWEVWISRNARDRNDDPISDIRAVLQEHGVEIGERLLVFPEHYVYLMHATARQLSSSILYTDRLAEIRMPRDTADFFTYLPVDDQQNWVGNLATRVNYVPDAVSVCLLDTGVTIRNSLLAQTVSPDHLVAINPSWTVDDARRDTGHGTPMAGLAMYGDLTDLFAGNGPVNIHHKLESVKMFNGAGLRSDLRGAVTREAVARAEILNPGHKRIFSLSITSWDLDHKGQPSSWSSAIDQLLFEGRDFLFMVSGGNLDHASRLAYPLANDQASIEDPAQAYNAITVGAYTLKDQLDLQRYPGASLLANRGALSPASRTSADWDKQWCRKPDIVMEGGNHGINVDQLVFDQGLQLLSVSTSQFRHPPLIDFGDTSGATALAARFGAQLYREYPALWPETIRGLIIHSADWTPAMLGNRSLKNLSAQDKNRLFRQVGYGVPNMERARYSTNNSLSLIAQRSLKPYKWEDYRVKTDEFHLFELPWPMDVLQALFNTEVTLKITLSYFIEPNPGSQQYKKAASYMSHGLRFKLSNKNEGKDSFLARISKVMEIEDDDDVDVEDANWVIGERTRNKGSIHKDLWIGPAVDLANRNKIAVYPVGGWWKNRKKLERYNEQVRYSLIVTIETPENLNEVDIYTPVMNQIRVDIPVGV